MYYRNNVNSKTTHIPINYLTLNNVNVTRFKAKYSCHCAWLPWPEYLTVHDSHGQDSSLCMTPWFRIPHCAWLLDQDTSLCMTSRDGIPQCAWLPESRYLIVHDFQVRIHHCAWLQGQNTSPCMTPGPGYRIVHDTRVRIPYCAWLYGSGYLTVHDPTGFRWVMQSEVSWQW